MSGPPSSLKKTLPALAFLAPAVLVLVLVVAVPIGHAAWISLHRWNLISGEYRLVGLRNYVQIFSDPNIWATIRADALYSGLGVTLQLAAGLALALLIRGGLARRIPGFQVFRVVVMVPLLVAPLIWAFFFRSFFSPQFGLFNIVLTKIGLPPVLWVNDPALALYSLVLADVWQWTPFMFSILLAGLLALPGDVVEAARVDGANRWQILVYVELPLLAPVMLVAIVMRVID